MYSKRSPPTAPAGMELPYISIPARWGIAPSTGISRLRRYSSIVGSICGVSIIGRTRLNTPRDHSTAHRERGSRRLLSQSRLSTIKQAARDNKMVGTRTETVWGGTGPLCQVLSTLSRLDALQRG